MKEQIKTDCCGKCSLFNFSYINTCRHPKTKGMVIEDVNKINKGCPLNDVKEK